MHSEREHHGIVRIYKSGAHLAFAFFVVAAPFIGLLIFAKLSQLQVSPLLFDVLISIARLIVTYTIAVIFALCLAMPYPKAQHAGIVLPFFDIMQSFPVYAVMPFVVAWLGANNYTFVFFLIPIIMWPILFSILGSMRRARHDWEEAIEIYNLEGWHYYKYYVWPLCIPGLISGSVIGLGEGWGALVATEMIINLKGGLGEYFLNNTDSAMITFFGVSALLIIVFSVNKLVWTPLLESSRVMMEE